MEQPFSFAAPLFLKENRGLILSSGLPAIAQIVSEGSLSQSLHEMRVFLKEGPKLLHSFEERVWEWVLDQLSSEVSLRPYVLIGHGTNSDHAWMLLDEIEDLGEENGREIL